MEIRLYFQMLKRGWWVVLLTALTAVVAALGASYIVTPQYKAVARFLLSPRNILPSSPGLGLEGLDILGNQTVITTYMEVMRSNRVYRDALAELDRTPEEMEDYVYEIQVLPNSSVIELSVTGPNPELAAAFTNSIGNQAIRFTSLLSEYYRVDFLDEALPPVVPESPQPVRDSILAFGIGLLLGGVLAIVRDQLMTSLDSYRLRFQLDNITGVYNRRTIRKFLEDELTQNPDGVLSAGIIELVGLADIEDTLPTSGYQNVLRQVTATLQKELRGHDIIGRWTDNSFLVILPKTPGPAAKGIFSRISTMLSLPVALQHLDLSIELTPYIGAAEYSLNISIEELLEKASEALENARKNKANPVYVWEMKNPFWNTEAQE
ncbi:MAG: diguanylate cyclase [Anaerolineales bacterium]|jgi:diguanylate cyclase (GGDEF)-like protein|nr:diguanylate cyclase [Chloroflexota bacterium]MBK6647651.1 diguanylate cyclase [Anaerolineales bacterium]